MSRGAYSYVRNRLWPTRKLFEGRQAQIRRELAELRGSVDALAARQEQAVPELTALRASIDALAARQEQILAWQEQISGWQAEIRTRVRRTQALTARAYEAAQRWPELLEAARAEPSYDLAYIEPDPLISIPISTYHSPDTLCERALASVLAQTHENWEAIVVGDHCTDDTEARVHALGDPRIRFQNLAVRENDPADPWERWAVKGSVPRSVGISLAAGTWIAPLSHDDEWDSDHLETLLSAARDARTEVVYSRMRVHDVEHPDAPSTRTVGAWPPRLGEYGWQSAMFHGALRFLRYDRACAFASEPNDWNLARRAWEAGVRFHFVDRATSTLYVYPRLHGVEDEYALAGLPVSAAAYP